MWRFLVDLFCGIEFVLPGYTSENCQSQFGDELFWRQLVVNHEIRGSQDVTNSRWGHHGMDTRTYPGVLFFCSNRYFYKVVIYCILYTYA